MSMPKIRTVAVIGAGVSGVCSAIHLKAAGLDVTVFERSAHVGGVWVYDERVAKDAAYPSILPSAGDVADDVHTYEHQTTREDSPAAVHEGFDLAIAHAPPGPCYAGLVNNVSTTEMELRTHAWESGTPDFVPHHVMAKYIQDAARANKVESLMHFNTRVKQIRKAGSQWRVETAMLVKDIPGSRLVESSQNFDAIVVASGSYHACNIPDIPGLSAWKEQWPSRVQHSKTYRGPKDFQGQNILLVGAGTSSLDIAREAGPVAQSIYQVSRGGVLDRPASMLPHNAIRIGEIESFDQLSDASGTANQHPIPGTITLKSGEKLCNIHRVILCTGYHVSYPFLRHLHADNVLAVDADEEVLVTDGLMTHNLHKDMFYIPDPTLAFAGVPYHIATFSLFEFQTVAIAAVFAGRAPLPSELEMRVEYARKVREKGLGRDFHSFRAQGAEVAYVDDILELANSGLGPRKQISGHSSKWHAAYARRLQYVAALKGAVRDAHAGHEAQRAIAACS